MTVCACGRPRRRGEKFCPECGARHPPIEPAESALPRDRKPAPGHRPISAQPTRYTVPERKQVAVLFADVCGSTEHIANVDPEEARAYLDQALVLMKEAIGEYEGTISQTLGDGVLALFGAPNAQEDYALRACLAGQDIQRRAREWNSKVGERDRSITVRVGIECGEVVVSCASEFLTTHYRADGLPVHVAKRLEGLAAPGDVVISGTTFRQVEHRIEANHLGPQALEGLDTEIDLYQLALRSAAAPLARRRHPAPLVGRSELLQALNAIAEQVQARQLRGVGLRGEAGVGKSRLIGEFCQAARSKGFGVCVVSAHAYTSHAQYAVAADLMREFLAVSRDMDVRLQLSAMRSTLDGWPDSERMHRAAAIDVLGLGDPGAAWLGLTPSQRRRRIGETLHWLVGRRVVAGPLLIVIDDIALADRESQRLLEQLLRRIGNLPVMFCTIYREGFQPRWAEAAWFTEFWVRLLERNEILTIARALLGNHSSLEAAIAKLADKADGNPFYLEQMALTLIDDGTLIGSPGAYRAVRPDAKLRVPASIAVVIGSRVDRLPAAAKASLEAASIVGEPFSSELLASMQNLPEGEIEDHLSLAAAAGLLTDDPARGSARHEFRHGLVQEVVAQALTKPRRKLLHRAALGALRAQRGEPSPDQSAVLAYHAYKGEMWPEAAEFALRSMSRSIARSANREALSVFDLGMDAARRVAVEPVRQALELGLLTETLGALLPLGRVDEILDNLERAGLLAKQLGDTRREAAVLLQLSVMLWTRGKYEQGLEAASKASEAAVTAGSRSLQMAAAQARMMLCHGLGRYQQVLEHARAVEQQFAAELAGRRIMAGWAVLAALNVKVFLADVLARMGGFDAAQEACAAAYRELTGHEHAFSRVLVDFVQGGIWTEQGRYRETVALLTTALQSCKANDVPTMYPPILAALGGAMALNGQVDEATALLRKAIDDKVHLAGGRYNEYYLSHNLAIALAEAGRYGEALAAAEDARRAAASYRQRGHEAEALCKMAEIEIKAGQQKSALVHLQQARSLAHDCSMTYVEGKTAESIARIMAAPQSVVGVPG